MIGNLNDIIIGISGMVVRVLFSFLVCAYQLIRTIFCYLNVFVSFLCL